MVGRTAMAIEIGRRRLRAILAGRNGGGVRVKRTLVADLPAGFASDDAKGLGQWIGEKLASAGFPQGRATIALARGHVGLKRLTLPTCDDNELPDMTRLALPRELPFDAEKAVIDYVPVERNDASTTVIAVAVPEDVLRRTKEIAAAAGLSIERIALRAMGSAALIASRNGASDECVLAIDITGDSVEFCIVENGEIRFSRAAEVPAGDDADDIAATVVTETRRTWMSYRIAEGASDVRRAVLMGDRRVVDAAVNAVAEMLNAETDRLDRHRLVESRRDDMDRVWPLAGLLLEPTLGGETIDFANPRRPVDRAARSRRWGVIAAGMAVVLLFAAWTFGHRELDDLRSQKEMQVQRRSRLAPDYAAYQRDSALLRHLEEWEAVDAEWLEHVNYLNGIMPAPGRAVLDSWLGSLDFRGVRYDRKTKEWSSPKVLTIIVDGEAKDRATADALREALVRTEWIVTASSGADAQGGRRLPFGYTYRLRTAEGAPPEEAGEEEPPAQGEMTGGAP